MRAHVAVLIAVAAACAPSRARRSPETVTVASPPGAASESLPTPPGPERAARRDELVESCLNEPWEAVERDDAPLPLPPEQADRLRSLMEPGCHDPHPELPPGRFAQEPVEPPVCSYAIAGIFYVYRHWIEAARWYRRVAFESEKGDDLGLFGAIRYVETLNVLADRSKPPRSECHALVVRDAESLFCRHCQRADADAACSELQRDRQEVARALIASDAGTDAAFAPLLPEGCPR